jgi:hypothetical protein
MGGGVITLQYNLSDLEERALRAATADPPAVWLRKHLDRLVVAYVAAGGAERDALKDAVDRADAATVAKVAAMLKP